MNEQLLNSETIQSIVQLALREDAAYNDITTTNLIPNHHHENFSLIANEEGILSGLKLLKEVMNQMSENIQIKLMKDDGDAIKTGDLICEISGPINKILSGERVALNFLQMLYGISSLTYEFIQKINSNQIIIRDTRKTRPLLRKLEKYAVIQGGGQNHRNTLEDFILIKDNHLNWAKKNNISITVMIEKYREKLDASHIIEIEVESIDDAVEALNSNVDLLLLDNMHVEQIKEICLLKSKSKTKIEISGGINLSNIHQYADLKIDYIAIGALIHSAKFFDFSLEIN